MIDENQQAVNEVENQPIDETPSSEVQEEAQSPDQTESQNQDQSVEAQPNEQEITKQTRAERRIRQLSEKLKERNSNEDFSRILNESNDAPLITPEDYEKGLDPKELERRVSEREQRRVAQSSQSIKQQLKAELAYEQKMSEHQADLLSVQESEDIKKNPALERMAVRLYEKENYLVDPRTGQTYFNPTIKLSEALNLVRKDLAEATGTAMASAQIKANQNQETVALSPSQGTSNPNNDYSEAFDKASRDGSDESWAEVLKKRGLANVS